MSRLEEAVLDDPSPVTLVAHSLGCHLVAAWASHSQHHARVEAALLVAPPDLDRIDMPPNLFNWRPTLRRLLPFTSHVVASSNDPFASLAASRSLAKAWGSQLTQIGSFGHINGDSGLGHWKQGLEILAAMQAQAQTQSLAKAG